MNDEVRQIAEQFLANACEQLAESGSLIPQAALIGDDERMLIVIDGNIMNSVREKRAFAEQMKRECERIKAHSTVFVSDMFFNQLSDEQYAKKRLIEQMLGMHINVEQMESAGIATKRETVMVMIQTKHGSLMIRRQYRRVGKTIVFEERTEETGKFKGLMCWLEAV